MPKTQTKPFHCPGCGREHVEAGRFCPLCGRDLKAYMDAHRNDPLRGKVIDQRYRAIKPIGRGGMGVVYHVEHIAMGKVMAMKLLHPHIRTRSHAVKRFRQEIKVVSRLQHVHTVSVFDCGDAEDGSLYIVMEYLRGLDLEKLLQHEKMLPCERTARIARQICASLGDAHKHGIIHRDIKPANIFLLRDGAEYDFVKVLDFGIAKLVEPGQEKVTEIGLIVGTPFYMAPEQARGSNHLGPTTDIYSLGIVMYEMVTGRLPFEGKTVADFIEAHLRFEPPPPSEVTDLQTIDPELEGIILRAINKDPSLRFPTADAMQLALDTYLERQIQIKVRASGIHFPSDYVSNAPSGERELPNSRVTERFQREDTAFTPTEDAAAFESKSIVPENIAATTIEPLPVESPSNIPMPFESDELPSEILASRADWDRVERSWQRKRRTRQIIPLFFLLGLLGFGGYYGWQYKDLLLHKLTPQPIQIFQQEHEPNDQMTQATTIPLNTTIPGTFGEAKQGRPSDYDWYRISLPQNRQSRISVELKPPPFANVELGLYQLEKIKKGNLTTFRPKEIRTTDAALRGGVERIPAYLWKGGDLYILVRELVIPGESSQRGPYQITVKILPQTKDQETEPNDGFQQATALKKRQTVSGFHNFKGDVDYYRFNATTKRKRKAFCKIRFNQSTKDNRPQLAILSAEGKPIRPRRIKRFSFYVHSKLVNKGKPKKKGRKKRGKRIHKRAVVLTVRISGIHFIRIKSGQPDTEKPYTLQFRCR